MNYNHGDILEPMLKLDTVTKILMSKGNLLEIESPYKGSGRFVTLTEDLYCFNVLKTLSRSKDHLYIANLIIPTGSMVYLGFDQYAFNPVKLRASRAKVHSIVNVESKKKVSTVYPFIEHHSKLRYTVGTTVRPDSFSFSFDTCSNGIHFFLDVTSCFAFVHLLDNNCDTTIDFS